MRTLTRLKFYDNMMKMKKKKKHNSILQLFCIYKLWTR